MHLILNEMDILS